MQAGLLLVRRPEHDHDHNDHEDDVDEDDHDRGHKHDDPEDDVIDVDEDVNLSGRPAPESSSASWETFLSCLTACRACKSDVILENIYNMLLIF